MYVSLLLYLSYIYIYGIYGILTMIYVQHTYVYIYVYVKRGAMEPHTGTESKSRRGESTPSRRGSATTTDI